jgi:hypothetical protein
MVKKVTENRYPDQNLVLAIGAATAKAHRVKGGPILTPKTISNLPPPTSSVASATS